ncbi:hypothetical protein EYF80_020099 [Liparis tanakae]|uniref:Uncharacterized protein n=1 Tax=Liparis tanakae TaxID=230148 RepID=A0A4Z2HWM0_9TELE|nr:hypothetical protein EYF80_020099 [Liparis tanakae]
MKIVATSEGPAATEKPRSSPVSSNVPQCWSDGTEGAAAWMEKPMAQGPPGGVIGILGGFVAIGLIVGVAVTVYMVHRRQQKTRTETDNDLCPEPFVVNRRSEEERGLQGCLSKKQCKLECSSWSPVPVLTALPTGVWCLSAFISVCVNAHKLPA